MTITNLFKTLIKRLVLLSVTGLPRGYHITRYSMYKQLAGVVEKFEQPSGKILSISSSDNLCKLFKSDFIEIVNADFPEHDICALPFPDNEFDYVVSDQVLEHVEGNPQLAIDETYRVLKPGGIAIHTTCFVNPIHWGPGDFWRFSPDALSFLCAKFSKIINVGGFGNPYIWLLIWLGLRFEPVPEAEWHPWHKIATLNDESCPISTWIVAQK